MSAAPDALSARDQVAGFVTDLGLLYQADAEDFADAVLAVPAISDALELLATMTAEAPVVIVPRRFLVEVDSVCSITGYRYSSKIPEDIRAELLDLSSEARRMYEGRLRAADQSTPAPKEESP